MSDSGREVWLKQALPQIHDYYERALAGFSVNDMSHTLHYLLKMLENMQGLDAQWHSEDEPADTGVPAVG